MNNKWTKNEQKMNKNSTKINKQCFKKCFKKMFQTNPSKKCFRQMLQENGSKEYFKKMLQKNASKNASKKCFKEMLQKKRQPWLSKHVLESHDGTYWTRRRYSVCRIFLKHFFEAFCWRIFWSIFEACLKHFWSTALESHYIDLPLWIPNPPSVRVSLLG